MPPSRIGTIDPLDTKVRVYVDENLKVVSPGSTEAAFVYRRADLDRVVARRKELGLQDEPSRVQIASHKAALADAERRAAAAEADVEILRARVEASESAETSAKSTKGKADE